MVNAQRPGPGFIRIGGRDYSPEEQFALKYARRRPAGTAAHDPAMGIPDTAPNFGRVPVPHVLTFSGLATSVARAYRNPDEAIRHSKQNAIAMRKDPVVMECLEARQRGTALLNWHLEPCDPRHAGEKALADGLTKILRETWRFTEYRRNLLEALWYGKSGIEHEYHTQMRYSKRQITIGSWVPMHGDKIVFRFDDGTGRYDPHQIGIRILGAYKLNDILAGDRIIEPDRRRTGLLPRAAGNASSSRFTST